MQPSFAALSHPVRRRILETLSQGPAPVHAIAGQFDLSQQAVSKHLKLLSAAGLASCERRGQENIYHLRAAPLAEVKHWLEAFWTSRLSALKDLAEGGRT